MVYTKSQQLDSVVHSLGYQNVEAYAIEKAKNDIVELMKSCQEVIHDYEKKYQMDYIDFCAKFHQISVDLFEKEEDSADWKTEIKLLDILQKRMTSLF